MAFKKFTEVVEIKEGMVKVKNKEAILKSIDELIFNAVFEESDEIRTKKFLIIKEIAKEMGAIPSSIQGLYEEMGKNF